MDETRGEVRGGVRPVAVVSHRAVSGLGLVVFPELRVRAALPAGSDVEAMSDEDLSALASAARPLTATETILKHDDEHWLVQGTGPVWAEGGASDACGLLFTCLDGSSRRWAIEGRPPGPLPGDEELRELLDRARRPPD